LSANNVTVDQLAYFVPHQANRRILEATAKRLGLPPEKLVINVDRVGNTSGASIPLALDELNRQGKLKEGDLLLLDAFGGGFAWGSALLRW
jgi:3-oxoacyl-[acyl-carrier-protein] synthase-3